MRISFELNANSQPLPSPIGETKANTGGGGCFGLAIGVESPEALGGLGADSAGRSGSGGNPHLNGMLFKRTESLHPRPLATPASGGHCSYFGENGFTSPVLLTM